MVKILESGSLTSGINVNHGPFCGHCGGFLEIVSIQATSIPWSRLWRWQVPLWKDILWIHKWDFPKIGVPPNHPFQYFFPLWSIYFWGTPIYGKPQISQGVLKIWYPAGPGHQDQVHLQVSQLKGPGLQFPPRNISGRLAKSWKCWGKHHPMFKDGSDFCWGVVSYKLYTTVVSMIKA